jgi:hypothetical protein
MAAESAPAHVPKVDEPKPIVPGSMKNLYTFVPAAMVEPGFRELAKTWPTWDSATHQPPLVDDQVHFKYDGDYGSERVLVASGRANIVPDDGSPTVTIGPGDAVYLHHGFSCTWNVLEAMVQNYGYFDKDGVEIAENELTCDICGEDCFEESYLYNDEMDICVRCYKSDQKGAEEYTGAEYQREGKAAKTPAPKRSPGKPLEGSAKKAKTDGLGDYAPPGEEEDSDSDDGASDDSGDDDDKKERRKEKKSKKKKKKKEKADVDPDAPGLPEHRWFADGETKGPRVKYTA